MHDLGQGLAAQADHTGEDDLGPDPGLFDSSIRGHRVVGRRMGLLDLPFVEALKRTSLDAVAVNHAAGTGPPEHHVTARRPRWHTRRPG